jgi:hypothetical protein
MTISSLEQKRQKKYDCDQRHRKTEMQNKDLMRLYHASKGEPSREEIEGLSKDLELKEIQVYKWVWDTRQR